MSRINLPKEKQVGHLSLLRQDRQISTKEYNALSAAERLDMIRKAQGKKKYDLLLNAVDAETLATQLHPQELYLTVNELGAEYSVELLMLADGDQVTTLLDLDCWEGDSLSPVLSLFWLQLLLETGPEKVCQLMQEIEPEIIALFLKKHMVITRGLEAYDDDDAENAKRLESLYDIDFSSEDAAKVIGALLRILMENAQESYLLLMEMVRSEVGVSLEEEVFQARNNRLSDLGFISPVEAKSVYSYIDIDSFKPGNKLDYRLESDGLQSPAALLAQANPQNLLADVLGNGLSHELATELCMLVNRKMSADETDISSAKDVSISLQQLYDVLNLALEHLCGTDVSKAEQLVQNTYLLTLFQYGHSLLKNCQEEARAILSGPIGAYLDYPEQLFLDALLEQPPVLYREAYADKPSDLQPVNQLRSLSIVDARLHQTRELERLFCELLPFKLPASDADSPEGLSLSMLFLTAVANQLLEREFRPQPLTLSDLAQLVNKATQVDRQPFNLESTLQTLATDLGVDCPSFFSFCVQCWEEDLSRNNSSAEQQSLPLSLLLEETQR